MADDDADQIRRHHHGVGEPDANEPRIGGLTTDLGRVRERGHVLGDHQRQRERRLQIGLVPAREVAPGVGGLEVRRDDDVLGAGIVGVARAVHPLHEIAEPARELQSQRVLAGGEHRRQLQREPACRGIGHRLVDLDHLLVGADQRAGVHGDLGAVEHDLAHGLVHRDRDVDGPVKGRRRGIEPQLDRVARRGHGAWQPERRALRHRPTQSSTKVSQSTYRGSSPLVAAKNASCNSLVTGPRCPTPIARSSTSRIGVISAAVPVKKTSSAR